MKELESYKSEIDELVDSYLKEQTKLEKKLQSMEGKFTESYIEESRKNWKPEINYGEIAGLARQVHQDTAMGYLDELEGEMDKYFQSPVDSGFATTITAIKTMEVTLGDKEFEMLEKMAGGFWGLKMLHQLGVSRTKTKQVAELENGEMKRTERESKLPYTGLNLPSIKKAYDSLQDVRNALDMAFSGYCGMHFELKNIMFPLKQANENFKEEYGVEPPKQMHDAMTITKMASSIQFFDENHYSYVAFSEMMDSLQSTMPKPKKKDFLTEDDKKLIDALIDPKYGSLAKKQAVEVAKADERLAELLALDSRYAEVLKGVREASENE